ncbi:MAG: rhomboid family intramembrane serine protease [Bdellovibrionales bacterium]|nr:rhomboid family intramembrane serine protease [Bdellovibrionales bacterium]
MQLRLSPTVKILLIVSFVVFLVQQSIDQFMGGHLLQFFGLVPRGFMLEGRVWQIVTYAFIHADPLHLILNMMMLAFVASDLEFHWGRKRFLQFYFFCAVAAGLLYLMLQLWIDRGGMDTPMVGASGAIYGCLMAYGLLFGERVLLFMMLFPMKAKHFIWVLAGVEFLSTVFSGRGGLSSAAHIGGMLAGLGYLWVQSRILAARRNSEGRGGGGKKPRRFGTPSKKKHLKLVIDNKDEDDRDPEDRTWH